MNKKCYDEASVIRSLSKKNSIRINKIDKVIEVLKDNTEVGIGSWGKIDYLHKVHGYIYVFVKSLSGNKSFNNNEDNIKVGSNKTAKREAKFNMATMSKNAMRKAKSK